MTDQNKILLERMTLAVKNAQKALTVLKQENDELKKDKASLLSQVKEQEKVIEQLKRENSNKSNDREQTKLKDMDLKLPFAEKDKPVQEIVQETKISLVGLNVSLNLTSSKSISLKDSKEKKLIASKFDTNFSTDLNNLTKSKPSDPLASSLSILNHAESMVISKDSENNNKIINKITKNSSYSANLTVVNPNEPHNITETNRLNNKISEISKTHLPASASNSKDLIISRQSSASQVNINSLDDLEKLMEVEGSSLEPHTTKISYSKVSSSSTMNKPPLSFPLPTININSLDDIENLMDVEASEIENPVEKSIELTKKVSDSKISTSIVVNKPPITSDYINNRSFYVQGLQGLKPFLLPFPSSTISDPEKIKFYFKNLSWNNITTISQLLCNFQNIHIGKEIINYLLSIKLSSKQLPWKKRSSFKEMAQSFDSNLQSVEASQFDRLLLIVKLMTLLTSNPSFTLESSCFVMKVILFQIIARIRNKLNLPWLPVLFGLNEVPLQEYLTYYDSIKTPSLHQFSQKNSFDDQVDLNRNLLSTINNNPEISKTPKNTYSDEPSSENKNISNSKKDELFALLMEEDEDDVEGDDLFNAEEVSGMNDKYGIASNCIDDEDSNDESNEEESIQSNFIDDENDEDKEILKNNNINTIPDKYHFESLISYLEHQDEEDYILTLFLFIAFDRLHIFSHHIYQKFVGFFQYHIPPLLAPGIVLAMNHVDCFCSSLFLKQFADKQLKLWKQSILYNIQALDTQFEDKSTVAVDVLNYRITRLSEWMSLETELETNENKGIVKSLQLLENQNLFRILGLPNIQDNLEIMVNSFQSLEYSNEFNLHLIEKLLNFHLTTFETNLTTDPLFSNQSASSLKYDDSYLKFCSTKFSEFFVSDKADFFNKIWCKSFTSHLSLLRQYTLIPLFSLYDNYTSGWSGGNSGEGLKLFVCLVTRLNLAKDYIHNILQSPIFSGSFVFNWNGFDPSQYLSRSIPYSWSQFTSASSEILCCIDYLKYLQMNILPFSQEILAQENISQAFKKLMLITKQIIYYIYLFQIERVIYLISLSLEAFLLSFSTFEFENRTLNSDSIDLLLSINECIQSFPAPWGVSGYGRKQVTVTLVIKKIYYLLKKDKIEIDSLNQVASKKLLTRTITSWGSNIQDFFPCFVINLNRRNDRFRKLLTRNISLGLSLHRVEAIDGSDPYYQIPETDVSLTWNPSFNSKFDPTNISNPNTSLTLSERACAASHLKIWRMIVEYSHNQNNIQENSCLFHWAKFLPYFKLVHGIKKDFFLICEDDFLVPGEYHTTFHQKLIDILRNVPDDWDIIYLGGITPNKAQLYNEVKCANGLFLKVNYIWMLHAYIINPRTAKLLLDALPITGPVDNFISQMIYCNDLNAYLVSTELMKQSGDTLRQRDLDSNILHSGRSKTNLFKQENQGNKRKYKEIKIKKKKIRLQN